MHCQPPLHHPFTKFPSVQSVDLPEKELGCLTFHERPTALGIACLKLPTEAGVEKYSPRKNGQTLQHPMIRSWWFRNPIPNHLRCIKPPVNNGINFQPQLVQDFFHQEYGRTIGYLKTSWHPTIYSSVWLRQLVGRRLVVYDFGDPIETTLDLFRLVNRRKIWER